jgi:hypothetical protein
MKANGVPFASFGVGEIALQGSGLIKEHQPFAPF